MAILSPQMQEVVSLKPRYALVKRILDVVMTLLLLPLIGLIFLVFAVLIRLDSKGPIFFKQRRVGWNGVEFEVYKFRSMHVHCDESVHREAFLQYKNGEPLSTSESTATQFKLVDDPRVTRVGRFIRKTSIDEVPQFINVLRGEMSLVGPRPPIPYEVEYYTERDQLRLLGKPGLTGFWQVYGRSRVTFAEMVEMDIAYLQRQSILEDLKLMILTVPVLLLGRGGA